MECIARHTVVEVSNSHKRMVSTIACVYNYVLVHHHHPQPTCIIWGTVPREIVILWYIEPSIHNMLIRQCTM